MCWQGYRQGDRQGDWQGGAVLLTRYTHSCVRLESCGRVLVIDPGIWSEPEALRGADAVLVTHEHADHVDVLRLAGLGVPVHAPAGASITGLPLERVEPGARFTAAGFSIEAVGGRHAPVLPGAPRCANLGYVVTDDGEAQDGREGDVYHPGDALHVPATAVGTLLVPLQASWLKLAEAVDFVRSVAPRQAVGIHDAQVNERGLAGINGWLTTQGRTDYRYLPPGTSTGTSGP